MICLPGFHPDNQPVSRLDSQARFLASNLHRNQLSVPLRSLVTSRFPDRRHNPYQDHHANLRRFLLRNLHGNPCRDRQGSQLEIHQIIQQHNLQGSQLEIHQIIPPLNPLGNQLEILRIIQQHNLQGNQLEILPVIPPSDLRTSR